ncbi:hypothetical protein IWX49DRAFT_625516 [Phyllosticta citricarpa]|uniref:Hexosyltransferase n=1 Tax=Phyllosticta paracitricarpa TaxID=2016321 RepID=A0ABR1N8W6_9PEZI
MLAHGELRLGGSTLRLKVQKLLVLVAVSCSLLLLWNAKNTAPTGSPRYHHAVSRPLPRYWSVTGQGALEGETDWIKPEGLRIVGLVFFGRPESVGILDCYLKRNLVSNGGLLDEVIFLARTTKQEDLEWLDALVTEEPAYTRIDLLFEGIDYASAYDVCENGTMYIKMDDDLVFMEDHAVATLVKTKIEHPEYFVVAANVVNQPSLSWMHFSLGAVHPYFPELLPPPPGENSSGSLWRASELPRWHGPVNWIVPHEFEPPFNGHRWLPLPAGFPLDQTPIANTSFDAFSESLWHWTHGAQQHYSFFENLEKNELWRYKFPMLDYNYRRMGIQMIAIWGDDIIASDIHNGNGDDEYHFTEVMTERTGRHAVVDGRALVAHHSFLPQRSGIAATDALQRYRAYAAEMICPR